MSAANTFFAIYRPHNGKEKQLQEILKQHISVLRAEGLISNFEAIYLQSEDNTILEIAEWATEESADRAHTLPSVQNIWGQIGEVAEFGTLGSLPESAKMFPNFRQLVL